MRQDLQSRWDEARRTQAKYYDKKVQPRTYSIGDRVWLSGRNIRTIRPSKKLDNKYYGPFRIVDAHGEQAYELELKGTLKGIHPVFHISLLEPYTGREGEEPTEPPPETVEGEPEWEVEKILDSKKSGKTVLYLVKWLGYSEAEKEWLPAENLEHSPDLIEEFYRRYPSKPQPKGEQEQAEDEPAARPKRQKRRR